MLKITIKDGVIVDNRDGLKTHFLRLPDGDHYVITQCLKPKSISEWRNLYFILRDTVYKDGETGYTKDEIHIVAKNFIIPRLAGDEENFIDDKLPELSTKVLSAKGWSNFILEFKLLSQQQFNCYI